MQNSANQSRSTFGHTVNTSCQSCMAGGTNSSRFLAGMHSVDIAEYSMPRGMSNKMQQRSLKQQLLVWKDYASDPLNLGRPKSCGFIGRNEESLLCFFCGPKLFVLFADGLRILPCHYFNPNVTTSQVGDLQIQSGDFSLILCAPHLRVSAPKVTCAAFTTLVDWRLSWVTIM